MRQWGKKRYLQQDHRIPRSSTARRGFRVYCDGKIWAIMSPYLYHHRIKCSLKKSHSGAFLPDLQAWTVGGSAGCECANGSERSRPSPFRNLSWAWVSITAYQLHPQSF